MFQYPLCDLMASKISFSSTGNLLQEYCGRSRNVLNSDERAGYAMALKVSGSSEALPHQRELQWMPWRERELEFRLFPFPPVRNRSHA